MITVGNRSIPADIIEEARKRGAVKWAYPVHGNRYGQLEPWRDMVHFFAADNREVGLVTVVNVEHLQLFEPPHRVWYPPWLEQLQFHPLPELSCRPNDAPDQKP